MASESFEIGTDIKVEKPDISQLVGTDGAFNKMLCEVESLMNTQFKLGRIKGTDYSKVLADTLQAAIKSSTDFVTQRELVAAQALYYKWQAEKFKQDSILVTSQEIKMKAELANEVLKGCLTQEQIKTQEEQTAKVHCESLKCAQETLKIAQEIKNLKQIELKLVEETAVAHKMVEQTAAKTANIRQHTQLIEKQTKHEVKKTLVTVEQIELVKNQATHETNKNLKTIQEVQLVICQTKHECAKEADVKAHTKWMLEHAKVEHELIAYTKAKADLERKRIDTETKRIALMQAQIELEKAKLPLICAQAKVELRKADMMAYDALYKKMSALVKAKEIGLKKAELALMCARTKSEQTKAYLTKYQAMGVYEQAKTEQVKREVAKYGILEAKAKAKAMAAQVQSSLVNAQLLKQKVQTELAQGKVLEGKLELFSAQYAGLVNDGILREQKLKDDVRIAQATLLADNGEVTGLNEMSATLTDATEISSTITEAAEVVLEEGDIEVEFETTDVTLPDGDEMPDLDCEIEDEDIEVGIDSIPFSDLDCSSGSISSGSSDD